MAGTLCGVAPTSVKFKLDAQAVKNKSDLLSDLKLDIACISETHGLCDAD